MRIGLIDVDGHDFPNIPLMKLSAYHKKQGSEVEWYDPWKGIIEPYAEVYKSKVFSFTPDYDAPIYAEKIYGGGTGYAIKNENGIEVFHKELDPSLPNEIEHIYPDYSLYGIEDTAYGFLTRGCPRGCDFCHVAPKEGRGSYKVADLDEFWKGQKDIVLCDPNILASKDHKDLLQQLIDSKAWIDLNQGVDIRLVSEANIDLIRKLKVKCFHFAYDRIEDSEWVEPKLKMFKEATGYNRGKVMVYVLSNFNTTIEEDLHRIYFCRELDFQPYVMLYDKEHCDKEHRHLQRWVNNPYIFWKTPRFEDYRP